MENVASIEINCPIDKVYQLATEKMPEWSLVVMDDQVIEEKPGGVGSTFRTITEDHGRRMEFDGVVTKCSPPCLHAVEMKGRVFDIESEFVFERISPVMTKVTQRAKVKGKGLFGVVMFLTGWLMKKSQCEASENELKSLKRYCEAGGEAG